MWVRRRGAQPATAADQAVAALREAHRLLDPAAERVEAPLDGASVVANLRRPLGAERPPLVVLIAGLDSTKEEFFLLENLFHARGMATLSLDGPGQGEGGYELPLRHDFEVGVAAILDAVDGFDRVGALGVSLGGYYAPRAATFEPRISAVAGHQRAVRLRRDLGPPAAADARDVRPQVARAPTRRTAAARASALNLDGVVEQLDKPALFVTGKLDRLIPWEETKRAADAAPQGEFVLFEDGNHVCANVPYKARPLVADWLREKLA